MTCHVRTQQLFSEFWINSLGSFCWEIWIWHFIDVCEGHSGLFGISLDLIQWNKSDKQVICVHIASVKQVQFPVCSHMTVSLSHTADLLQHQNFGSVKMMMTIYRAWIYPCCNSMLTALKRPQSSSWLFLSLLVHTGCVCVPIIHQALTWTTGSLSCIQMLMHVIAHGGVQTPKESALKVDSGKKISCHTRELNLHRQCDGPML